MNDHAGGLVDDRYVFILKDDIERNAFGFKGRGRDLDKFDVKLVTFADLVRRFCLSRIDQNIAVVDQPPEA
jgi:hypothetical protein